MHKSLTAALTALTVLAAASLAAPADPVLSPVLSSVLIGYAPAAGTSWHKTFEVTADLGFDGLAVVSKNDTLQGSPGLHQERQPGQALLIETNRRDGDAR